jgi:hypothetical protein
MEGFTRLQFVRMENCSLRDLTTEANSATEPQLTVNHSLKSAHPIGWLFHALDILLLLFALTVNCLHGALATTKTNQRLPKLAQTIGSQWLLEVEEKGAAHFLHLLFALTESYLDGEATTMETLALVTT